jgi:drug/metabolite transporter (DMT)-like permease
MPVYYANARWTPPALFSLLCLAWGSGWLALKIGVAALPPLFYASSRFVAAGVILFCITVVRGGVGQLLVPRNGTLIPGAMLMIAANYGLMAWGAMRVTSGLAAVVNLATVPLAIAVCGALYGQTRFTWRVGVGLASGSAGLVALLAWPVLARSNADQEASVSSVVGLAAISAGAACYAWGSILTRRTSARIPALTASTIQALAGGLILLSLSALYETWGGIPTAFSDSVRTAGWLFLVTISVVSTPLYIWLLVRWEPTRLAAYAYVCPVIAVAEGVLLGGESLSVSELIGAVLLGAGAYWVLRQTPAVGNPDTASRPEISADPISTKQEDVEV